MRVLYMVCTGKLQKYHPFHSIVLYQLIPCRCDKFLLPLLSKVEFTGNCVYQRCSMPGTAIAPLISATNTCPELIHAKKSDLHFS